MTVGVVEGDRKRERERERMKEREHVRAERLRQANMVSADYYV